MKVTKVRRKRDRASRRKRDRKGWSVAEWATLLSALAACLSAVAAFASWVSGTLSN